MAAWGRAQVVVGFDREEFRREVEAVGEVVASAQRRVRRVAALLSIALGEIVVRDFLELARAAMSSLQAWAV